MTDPSGHVAADRDTAVDRDTAADADESTAARRVLLLAVAALATAMGAVIVLVAGGGGGDDLSSPQDAGAVVDVIGPAPGVDVGGYVTSRQDAITTIDGSAIAVVSFETYVAADAVTERLGGDVRAHMLLVALPGAPPAVTTDPGRHRTSTVADAEAQIVEITGLLPSVDDAEFAAFYRAELARYGQIVATADRADIVFAAVVRATGPQLRAIASREGVRLVDLVAGASLADDASITGLRPEETTTTGSPEFRPT